MKTKKRSKPNFIGNGTFAVLRFVPGDHVKVEFDAWSNVEVVVMAFGSKGFVGEKPAGKEEDLPF